jgi:hypothetical protein
MSLWISVSLFVCAVVIARPWWGGRRVDALGRARSFPLFSVAALVLLGIAALTPWFLRVRLEHRLSGAASTIVGSSVEVHCQTAGETFTDAGADLGYVAFGPDGVPERRTTIKWEQCRALASFAHSKGVVASRDEMIAVHVLTHEAMHMSGVRSEAESECRAMQRDARMARLLGAEGSDARYLASWYWHTVYPHMSPAYRSEDCGPGQALDAGLPDPPWGTGEPHS